MTVVGGLVWAALVLASSGAAAQVAAVVLVPVAVVAAASGVRAVEAAGAGRRRGRRNRVSGLAVVAVLGAVVVPVAALGGRLPALAALAVLTAVAALSGRATVQTRRVAVQTRRMAGSDAPAPLAPAAARLVVTAGPAAASASVILARQQHASGALALLAAVLAFDAGAFMMGNARTTTGGPVGVAFGFVSVAVVAVFVAAMMVPPFSGARPWIVFATVGLLAAAGVWLCDRAVGGARSPALRRLDSLMLAGPAWIVALAILGYH